MNTNPNIDVIYQGIEAANDTDLKCQLYRRAMNYALIRAEWYFLTQSERLENDPKRSAAHNAFIDACNILSRAMYRTKEDNSWRAKLGEDRKAIGDFACYVAYRLGVMMR